MIQQNDQTMLAHHDLAEKLLLGMMLNDKSYVPKLRRLLTPQDFFTPQHQLICAGIFDAADQGQFYLVPVRDLLLERGELSKVGRGQDAADGEDYLTYLQLERNFDIGNFQYYVEQVRQTAKLRRLLSMESEMIGEVRAASPGDVAAIVARHQERLAGLDRQQDDELVEIGADVDAAVERAELVRRGELSAGLSTGFAVIDELTAGLGPADVWLVGGATSIGKSAFALAVTTNVLKAGGRVLYISREMQRPAIATRLLSAEAKISSLTLRTGNLTSDQEESRRAAVERIRPWQLVVDDAASTVREISLRIGELSSRWREPLNLVVIDYLQLLRAEKGRSRVEEISNLMWSIKSLSMTTGIPFLCCSQLSREGVRNGNPPALYALRECGDLENMANLVLLLHRPDPPEFDSAGAVVLWAKVAKSRDGRTTVWPTTPGSGITFRFLPECTRLEEKTLSLRGHDDH